MHYLIIHNVYSRRGGEEQVVATQCDLLQRAGHTVTLYQRDHAEMSEWRVGRLGGFFSAFYNRRSVRDIRQLVEAGKPDAAIIHNLYPVISPAILPVLRKAGVRVAMGLHNYRLVCPAGTFFTHGDICERCALHRHTRELNCALRRCEGSVMGSVAFALRGWWARRKKYYTRNVDTFLALSEFQRDKLSGYTGVPPERFRIVPNCIDGAAMPEPSASSEDAAVRRDYVAYVGRLSAEKGVDLLLEIARRLPRLRFRVAGEEAASLRLPEGEKLPPNIEFAGFLSRAALADFYAGARCLVMTSRCYEGFGLSAAEAMYYGRPVVVPRLAAMAELADGCGLLYEAGNAAELCACIGRLFADEGLCASLSAAGAARVRDRYTPERYLAALEEL